MNFIKPRGTQDLFGEDASNFFQIRELLFFFARAYGLKYIITPIFESKDLFVRSVGTTSDIVKKEFFEFRDKSDRDMVLRPEGTAGVIRSVIENKLINKEPLPLKLFYFGPMFRYERPQSGRLRQFHQFGVEIIGSTKIHDHIEMLLMIRSLLESMEIKKYIINVNNIGTIATRAKWITALREYFNKYKEQLSPLSISRLETNPLRILDDKEENKKDFVQNAPNIRKFLTPEENNQFKEIVQLLKAAKIKIKITPNLVRGLDYYNNFVFEVNSTLPALAGQPTLVGGGQYDQLVPQLNGPNNVGCKGFALGVERLLLASSKKQHRYFEFPNVDAVIVSLDESCDLAALEIAEKIRYNGLFAITRIGTYKLEKYFNLAKEVNAKNLVIIGKNEMKKKSVIIKDQVTMHQTTVLVTDVVRRLKLARKKN